MTWTPYDWLNKFYNFYVAAVVIISNIEECCRKQTCKTKLLLYKPGALFYSNLKQLYISNKTEDFSYKGGYGVCGEHHMCIKAFLKEELVWATDS